MIRRGSGVIIALVMVFVASSCALEFSSNDESDNGNVETIKLGYLHTVAVDENLWVGQQKEIWKKHGIRFKAKQFNSGVTLSKALAGGSLDVGIMGSVISNFPARGQGTVFLANNIEAESVRLYGHSGISSIKDLKGHKIITTTGAAGHVVLDQALKREGVSKKSVEIVNADMPTAVNSFMSGSVPALVTWLPFNVRMEKKQPGIKPFATGDQFYSKDKGLLGGWVANNDFYKSHKDSLKKIVAGWLEVNPFVRDNPRKVVDILHDTKYKDMKKETLRQMHDAAQLYSNEDWNEKYQDGSVAKLIGDTERSFVDIGALDKFVDPKKFFDPAIFEDGYTEHK